MNPLTNAFQTEQAGTLPGLLGLEWIDAQPGRVRGRLDIDGHHLAPNGYLHAATVVALADSACGFGCRSALPDHASGFTTAELKTNFIGTASNGSITCNAHLIHAGRTTQLWDAEVTNDTTGKTIALFRCTQIILYPTL